MSLPGPIRSYMICTTSLTLWPHLWLFSSSPLANPALVASFMFTPGIFLSTAGILHYSSLHLQRSSFKSSPNITFLVRCTLIIWFATEMIPSLLKVPHMPSLHGTYYLWTHYANYLFILFIACLPKSRMLAPWAQGFSLV